MPTRLRISSLRPDAPHDFVVEPTAAAREAVAEALGLRSLRKLRFAGQLTPQGRDDWRLEAQLGATVVQDCGVTLNPVTTRIDEPVARTYLSDPPPLPDGEEIEMPEDDSIEPLPETVDLEAVMMEALTLAVPAYPRAPEAEAGSMSVTEPGKTAMTDDDVKPFAGLAALRDRMKGEPGD